MPLSSPLARAIHGCNPVPCRAIFILIVILLYLQQYNKPIKQLVSDIEIHPETINRRMSPSLHLLSDLVHNYRVNIIVFKSAATFLKLGLLSCGLCTQGRPCPCRYQSFLYNYWQFKKRRMGGGGKNIQMNVISSMSNCNKHSRQHKMWTCTCQCCLIDIIVITTPCKLPQLGKLERDPILTKIVQSRPKAFMYMW